MNTNKNQRSKIPIKKVANKRKHSNNTGNDAPLPSGSEQQSKNTSFDQNPEFKTYLKE